MMDLALATGVSLTVFSFKFPWTGHFLSAMTAGATPWVPWGPRQHLPLECGHQGSAQVQGLADGTGFAGDCHGNDARSLKARRSTFDWGNTVEDQITVCFCLATMRHTLHVAVVVLGSNLMGSNLASVCDIWRKWPQAFVWLISMTTKAVTSWLDWFLQLVRYLLRTSWLDFQNICAAGMLLLCRLTRSPPCKSETQCWGNPVLLPAMPHDSPSSTLKIRWRLLWLML